MNSSCYNSALKILVRRENSQLELRQKLKLKDFEEQEIDETILKLQQQNYQNDERFAGEFVQMRFNQGKGKALIKMQLQAKGIDSFDFSEFDFLALCKDIKLKKYGQEKYQSLKEKSSQIRFLQSRGFSFEEINSSIEN